MKRLITLSMILLIIAGCGGCKQSDAQSDDLIIVDVTANYPKIELILQDFMDVEYIPLETTDEFLTQGLVQAVGKDIIVVRNSGDSGDFFVYDRKTGKALRKINRRGQGAEEYNYYVRFVLDEGNNEIFVNDMYSKKILVYDLEGNFKRKLPHKDNFLFFEMYNFDGENLICRDDYYESRLNVPAVGQLFIIVSKQDGSITKKIQIPYEEKKSATVMHKNESSGQVYAYAPTTHHPIVPYFDEYVLGDVSADTVYRYSKDHTLMPLIVRTPSVQSMNPEVFLFISLFTDRYYFMEKVTKEIEFSGADLLYDREEKAIFRYTVYNGDYSNKEKAYLKSIPVNNEIPSCQYLKAPQLVEAYQKGLLKGRLKEIAATLDEDSNPVIMLIKHKK
jgi:hypothetical protein